MQREADGKAGRSQMILGSDAFAHVEAGIE